MNEHGAAADGKHGQVGSAVGVADIGVGDAKLCQTQEFVAPLIITRGWNGGEESHTLTERNGSANGMGKAESFPIATVIVGAVLLAVGFVASFALTKYELSRPKDADGEKE